MQKPTTPLVSVVLAVHNDAAFLPFALAGVLRQTAADLELIVVDDASTDETPAVLAAEPDSRLVVFTNSEQRGLAFSLNRGLAAARGRYVARLDADDVALPERLEVQLTRMQSEPRVVMVGTGVLDIDAGGKPGRLHEMPLGPAAVRWHSLFAAPLIHPTLLIEREALQRLDMQYDPTYLESEDYDLLTRLLGQADGANVAEPLVLKRGHAGQASRRRGELQRSFQREIALREIARIGPELSEEERSLAGEFGTGRRTDRAGIDAYLQLLAAFERIHGVDAETREWAARPLLRARRAFSLGIGVPMRLCRRRARRGARGQAARRRARAWLSGLGAARARRVTVVSPEPTPYRAPLFDRIAARNDVELTVIYAAQTVAGREWSVPLRHRAVFLRGLGVPGASRIVRHNYPITPGIVRALRDSMPEVVVVSGWSTFASQAAIAWCRAKRVPYVLHVESHDLDPRPRWRRAVKDVIASRAIRGARNVLAVGSAARRSVEARGATRVDVFANTIDVGRWIDRADALPRAEHDGFVVLSVGRDVPEKAFDVLARACQRAGVRLELVTGGLSEDELARRYAEADVFALLSRHEPWGVVVNEAAASGLPLVLSDRVGAAHDLLREGENGFLVPAEDVDAAAVALRKLVADPELRRRMGARSRELLRTWDYDASVAAFVDATSR